MALEEAVCVRWGIVHVVIIVPMGNKKKKKFSSILRGKGPKNGLFLLGTIITTYTVPISSAEAAEAKDQFQGRLTMEILEEKLGPSPACFYVRVIDLTGLHLKHLGSLLQDEIFPSLRELNLDDNPLTALGSDLGPCSKLVILKCSRTKISDLNNLGSPGQKSLNNNSNTNSASGLLTGIVGGGKDENKKDIDGKNKISSPSGLANLTNTNNPHNSLFSGKPTGLHTFYHLQVLELRNNGISDLSPLQNFGSLRALRFLNLEGNEISKIPHGCFIVFENLRELILCKNKLRIIDEEDFVGLKALRELRMEDNGCRSFKFNSHLVPKLTVGPVN